MIWDFDGTIATRPGHWGGLLLDLLDERLPGHQIKKADLDKHLGSAFPWQAPHQSHTELSTAAQWWESVSPALEFALCSNGVETSTAARMIRGLPSLFADAARRWHLFPDVLPSLKVLRTYGWRHIVLSNHAPELPNVVQGLGLGDLIDSVLTSALIGYEKPHCMSFEAAMAAARYPRHVVLVGDNVEADVGGAIASGIPVFHVVRKTAAVERPSYPLATIAAKILAQYS